MISQFVQRVVGAIYDFLRKGSLGTVIFPLWVKKNLQALEQSERTYYVQKLTYFIGILLFASCILAILLLKRYTTEALEITTIERPKAYEEASDITLEIDGKTRYDITIYPSALSAEEAERAFRELIIALETYLLGGNQSAEAIMQNLNLPSEIEGYPFAIYWESDKEHVIDSAGNVFRKNLREDELVTLTAVCTYKDYQWEWETCVLVLKENLSKEEAQKRELETLLIEGEETTRSEAVWKLPETLDGQKLTYNVVEETDTIWILLLLLFVTSIALWIGADKDLHSKRKKEQGKFEAAYLNFVSSLSMYVSAGLNLQMAMQYCVKDYAKRRLEGDVLREALLKYEKDIMNGHSFQGAVERLAERADHVYYRRLAGLLHQGLVNGTRDFAGTLQQEVDKIREDKRRQCRVYGEKISTALIAPMMLELGVVIALILMPAFSNMHF